MMGVAKVSESSTGVFHRARTCFAFAISPCELSLSLVSNTYALKTYICGE